MPSFYLSAWFACCTKWFQLHRERKIIVRDATAEMVDYLLCSGTSGGWDLDYIEQLICDGADVDAVIFENHEVRRRADVVEPVLAYKEGTGPLLYAFFREKPPHVTWKSFHDVVHLLVKSGADPFIKLKTERDQELEKPLLMYFANKKFIRFLDGQMDLVLTDHQLHVVLDAIKFSFCTDNDLGTLFWSSFAFTFLDRLSLQLINFIWSNLDFDKKVELISDVSARILFYERPVLHRPFFVANFIWQELTRDTDLFAAVEGQKFTGPFSLLHNRSIQSSLEQILNVNFERERISSKCHDVTPDMVEEARLCFALPTDRRPQCRCLHKVFGKYMGGENVQDWRPRVRGLMLLRQTCKKFLPHCKFLSDSIVNGDSFSQSSGLVNLPAGPLMNILQKVSEASIEERSDIFCSKCIGGVLPRVCKAFVKCPVDGVRINRRDASGCVFQKLDDDAFKAIFTRLVNIPYGGICHPGLPSHLQDTARARNVQHS